MKTQTVTIERSKLEVVLEALETYKGFIDDAHILEGQWNWIDGLDNVQIDIKEALAKQSNEQVEPVAWRVRWPKMGGGYAWVMNDAPLMAEHGFVNEPLYTHPPVPTAQTDRK